MKHIVYNKYKNPPPQVITRIPEESPVQTQFAADADINHIVGKYMRGEDISRYQKHNLTYGEEFPSENSYLAAQNKIRRVSEAFQALPATDRDFFENDPEQFLSYLSKEENMEDSYKRGYRIKPKIEPEKIQKVEVVPTPPPKEK